MINPPLDNENDCSKIYTEFRDAQKCQEVLKLFERLCRSLQVDPPTCNNHLSFYDELKKKSLAKGAWQFDSLYKVLDRKFFAKEAFLTRRKKKKCCETMKVLVIGGGPVGMRAAIEMATLGAKVVVIEMRKEFTRNNVLHLWPFLIQDIRDLAGKKFFGKFCSGQLDHVGIKQLQLMLLKTLLIFGIEYHTDVKYAGLIPPSTPDEEWKAKIEPSTSTVSQFTFDVIIGADARKNTFEGFEKIKQGGNRAIGITCNFENLNKQEDSRTEEISVSRQYKQEKFDSLLDQFNITLENCVYYRGETHYFVMTAQKQNLLNFGVLKEDLENSLDLLHPTNVDMGRMKSFTRTVANWATDGLLPQRKFADNGKGGEDIAIFDFTTMMKRKNASRFEERNGRKLLLALVGDALVEPFWPLGTGASRGFLGALDLAWMCKHWWSGYPHLNNPSESSDIDVEIDVLRLRENIYSKLHSCMCQDMKACKKDKQGNEQQDAYTIDPDTRYKRIGESTKRKIDVVDYYASDRTIKTLEDIRNEAASDKHNKEDSDKVLELVKWCSVSIRSFHCLNSDLRVFDMSTCWHSGLAYCALIQAYRPDLIDVSKLDPEDVCKNNQLAFDTAQQHLSIYPSTTGREVASKTPQQVDAFKVKSYVIQFYYKFKDETPVPYKPDSDVTMAEQNGDHVADPPKDDKKRTALNKVKAYLNLSKKRPQKNNGENESGQQKKPKPSLNIFKRKNKKYEVSNPAYNDKGEPANLSKFTSLSPPDGEKIQKENSLRRNQSMRNIVTSQKSMVRRSGSCRVGRRGQDEEGGSVTERRQRLMNNLMKNAPTRPKQQVNYGTVGRRTKVEEKENNEPPEQKDSSNFCYFCNQKIYLTQQQECENHFFHRKCFLCKHCQQPLNSFNYYYHKPTGEFFCQMHKSVATNKNAEKRSEAPEVATQEIPETETEKSSKFTLNPFKWFSKKSAYSVNVVPETPETENKPTMSARFKRYLWSFAPKCTLLEFLIDWLLLMVVGTCIMVAHHYITMDMIKHPDH